VAIGDDVLARLRAPTGDESNGIERVLIMHLVKRTAAIFELQQFNPDVIVRVDADHVESIHKIVGELI
jgi:hypothetical protein